MNRHPLHQSLSVFFAFTVLLAERPATAETMPTERQPTAEQIQFFESKIRPVLVRECYGCHSKQSGQAKGGLQLDSRAAMLLGGDSGPAIVPGDLDASLFFGAITHVDFVMPPKRKLSEAEIADFRRWIADGAPDPRITPTAQAPRSSIDDEAIAAAKQSFWAYQPPRRTPPTDATTYGDHTTVIDRYLIERRRASGLESAGEASAEIVLRRICFDLVGLPPTAEQLRWFSQAYQQDASVAVAHVVDRLLDTPQYGEHWGRHWLDVARYAESTGREVNMTFPHAWRYRDYVIDSFNDDKPYNEFVQEQIAGDLLPAKSDAQWSDHLIATTFLAVGTKNVNEQTAAQFAADLADEQIDATTRIFLGTSVACARCHDHKFDPIRQRDYYAMAGIFRSTKTFFGNPPSQYSNAAPVQQRRPSSLLLLPIADNNPIGPSYSPSELEQLRQQVRSIQAELVALRSGGRSDAQPQQRIRLINELSDASAKLAVVDDNGQPRSYCMGVQDRDQVGNAPLLVRGEIGQPTDPVPRGLPAVLFDDSIEPASGTSGRLELARWIGSDENTLAARVMVNRVWHHVFGQGIVPTTEDFGMTGVPPSHPELLDHLALEFVESGWSVKAMIRQMMLTRAYRMKSTFDTASHRNDPDNRLLWRSNIKRLGAESIRDAMLSAAGALETERPLGSKVAEAGYMRVRNGNLQDPRERIRKAVEEALVSRRKQQAEAMRRGFLRRSGGFMGPRRESIRGGVNRAAAAKAALQAAEEDSLDCVAENCRSVYLPIVRGFVPRSLEVFDFPDAGLVTGSRETSNTPNQALFMMNNPLTLRLSDSFARRVIDQAANTDERIDLAFRLAYGRPPNSDESRASHQFIRSCGLLPQSAMAAFCQSLFAAAEFRYLN